jgi:hypothetical protein
VWLSVQLGGSLRQLLFAAHLRRQRYLSMTTFAPRADVAMAEQAGDAGFCTVLRAIPTTF